MLSVWASAQGGWFVQDLLPPYLDVLISKLLVALQNGQRMVQEGSLTAMASVADCAKTHFIKFYDQVCLTILCSCTTHLKRQRSPRINSVHVFIPNCPSFC